jgi:hypothetical protein
MSAAEALILAFASVVPAWSIGYAFLSGASCEYAVAKSSIAMNRIRFQPLDVITIAWGAFCCAACAILGATFTALPPALLGYGIVLACAQR